MMRRAGAAPVDTLDQAPFAWAGEHCASGSGVEPVGRVHQCAVSAALMDDSSCTEGQPKERRLRAQGVGDMKRAQGIAGAHMRANAESTNCAGSAAAGSESSRRWMMCCS